MANIYAIHHEKETWGDPYVYRPERFLSPDGKTVIKHEALVAFSAGKRVCPGSLDLVFSNLIITYKLQ